MVVPPDSVCSKEARRGSCASHLLQELQLPWRRRRAERARGECEAAARRLGQRSPKCQRLHRCTSCSARAVSARGPRAPRKSRRKRGRGQSRTTDRGGGGPVYRPMRMGLQARTGARIQNAARVHPPCIAENYSKSARSVDGRTHGMAEQPCATHHVDEPGAWPWRRVAAAARPGPPLQTRQRPGKPARRAILPRQHVKAGQRPREPARTAGAKIVAE